MKSFDAIVVGGGHNGLVSAAYLARSGLQVALYESADDVGGGGRTEEFTPGYRVSSCAHLLHHLNAGVVKDLHLTDHGLDYALKDLESVALSRDGAHLVMTGSTGDIAAEGFSDLDRERWAALRGRIMRFASALGPVMNQMPSRLKGGSVQEGLQLARFGVVLRRLGRDDLREFARTILINVADLLEDEIDDDRLKGLIASDAVWGNAAGPRSPGTFLSLLYRYGGKVTKQPGIVALPQSGMGGVTESLRRAAESFGVTIVTGATVESIVVEDDYAAGVCLKTGDVVRSRFVVSAIDPRSTILDLVGASHFDTGFVRRINNIRAKGHAAKLHLALEGVPEFKGLDRIHLDGRLVIAPDIDYVERAFNASKYGEYSPQPIVEMIVPSVADPHLADMGCHVLSAIVQYAPYDLREGWQSSNEVFRDRVIDLIAEYAPNIREQIRHSELLSPLDIERRFGMPGGHWHHGELSADQMLMLRPVPGAAQYDTPLPGLYLAGAGSHPGGGIMGTAGRNAAQRAIEREGAA